MYPYSMLDEAKALQDEGRYAEAECLLQSLLHSWPGDWFIAYRLAIVQCCQGKILQAVKLADGFYEGSEAESTTVGAYTDVLWYARETKTAIAALEHALQYDPLCTELLHRLAWYQLGDGAVEIAEGILETLCRVDPDSFYTGLLALELMQVREDHAGFAVQWAYFQAQIPSTTADVESAAEMLIRSECYEEAYRFLKQNNDILSYSGKKQLLWAMFMRGLYEEAVQLGDVLAEKGYLDTYRHAYGRSLYAVKRYEEAAKAFAELILVDPDIRNLEWLALSEFICARFGSAWRYAESVLHENPESRTARWLLRFRRRLNFPLWRWLVPKDER
jgi:tetratricopeptide (TPR) repeat protein